MCGIHLILDKQSEPRPEAVGRMVAATAHRGPDAHQCQVVHAPRQVLSLGHNRLKISDLRDVANQPMATPDGRYWLLFNGAIYNFLSLHSRLRQGYHFRTQSDTEVLLYWLIENGPAGLAGLDGMYALAFYDCHAERLLLARDPWGMKPLFYAENDQYLVVSSEIRGILASGLVPKAPELGQVAHYLRFKFAQRPGTFYRGIFELEPGVAYASSPSKELSVAGLLPDGEAPEVRATPPDKAVLPRLTQALTETVSRHLQADVPAGLLLSGGVDSTLLLALAREAGVRDLPVFTVAYGAKDEAYATRDHHFARQAARQYGAAYHEVPVGRQLLESFWEWLPTLDQPIGDGAAWLTWLLARAAKKHVKVVLSGAGADELFGGYHRHWAFYQYLKRYDWLQVAAPLLRPVAAALPNYGAWRRWHKLGTQLGALPGETFVNFTAHLSATLLREELNTNGTSLFPQPAEWVGPTRGAAKRDFMEEHLQHALRYDQRHYLPGDVLAVTDRMTMQHGLEARLPYLGGGVAGLAQSLPATFRLGAGRKWLLREVLRQRGGAPYVQRRKEGFGMPFGHWLRTPAGKPLVELLRNQESAIFDVLLYKGVNRMLGGHLSGQRDYSSELWTLLVLAGWLEQEFGKGNRKISPYAAPPLVTGSFIR
jgi:asparagine synthase (glutamine-hydrolysing)